MEKIQQAEGEEKYACPAKSPCSRLLEGQFPWSPREHILGPTQPRIQLVPGGLSLEVIRKGREADHMPPVSVEVKSILHSPPYAFTA
jgi:hypothetical protein